MKTLLNKPQYKRTKQCAKQFAEMLSGDFGCQDGDANRLALESMISGWIMGQKHFGLWMASRLRKYPNTAIIDEVQDQAIQIACDVVGDHISGHARFRTATKLTYLEMIPDNKTIAQWKADYASLLRDYVSTRRQLNRIRKLTGI